MDKRILLKVAYDGTEFSGWQLQPNQRTVEGELNAKLGELLGEEIHVIGASRTDAGVHALGNLAVFDTQSQIPGEKIAYALNRSLPDDVVIQESRETAKDFHPRHCNSVKTYEYHICSAPFPIPTKRRTTYFTYHKLDEKLMNQAAQYLVGEHDFKSFCCVRTQAETTIRHIYQAQVQRTGNEIVIRVSGNGFLYNMVRIIAGTLMEIGRGKYPPERIKEMIEGLDRCIAGPTAPPEGLILVGIEIKGE